MNCIVTAGPAYEPLDDVRRLSGTTELQFARSEIDGRQGGLTVCRSGGIEKPADAAKNPPTGFRSRKGGFCAGAGRQGLASQISPCALSGIGGFERR